jgi:V8-like Glu-specific endopeptidase
MENIFLIGKEREIFINNVLEFLEDQENIKLKIKKIKPNFPFNDINSNVSNNIYINKIIDKCLSIYNSNGSLIIIDFIELLYQETNNVYYLQLVNKLNNEKPIKLKDYKSDNWNPELKNLQKVIESQNTFLNINFLEQGSKAAKSVCKIRVKNKYSKEYEVGTGFIIKDNILVTNHHVISNIEEANSSEFIFNFELSIKGNPLEKKIYYADSETLFKTDKHSDLTIIKIKDNPNKLFNFISFSDLEIKVGDFVNIIQHPDGDYKKIALYHNIVVFKDNDIIQYLTDTNYGSSGAPVFDSDWKVIAIHHKGGFLTEPNKKDIFFRNQGINANKIKKMLNG